MFLHFLNYDEKLSFIKLAYLGANYNNKFADEQKDQINTFAKEMNLLQNELKGLDKPIPLEELIKEFSNSTLLVKRIIMLEISALIMADKIFDEKEKEFVARLNKLLGIDENYSSKTITWINKYNSMMEEVLELLNISSEEC